MLVPLGTLNNTMHINKVAVNMFPKKKCVECALNILKSCLWDEKTFSMADNESIMEVKRCCIDRTAFSSLVGVFRVFLGYKVNAPGLTSLSFLSSDRYD